MPKAVGKKEGMESLEKARIRGIWGEPGRAVERGGCEVEITGDQETLVIRDVSEKRGDSGLPEGTSGNVVRGRVEGDKAKGEIAP
jgi:hypothetical protein